MTALTYPKFQAPDINGVNLAGGKIYFYEAGTSTPLDTYSDSGLTTPNTNPVVLDSRGEADIYLANDSYKIVLKTSADVEIWSIDNYLPILGTTSAFYFTSIIKSGYVVATKAEAAALTLTSADAGRKIFITSTDGGEFTVEYNVSAPYADDGGSYCGTQFIPSGGDGTIGIVRDYDGVVNVKWFGAALDGSTDDSTELQAAIDAGVGDVFIDGDMAISSTVTHASGVKILLGADDTITWTGSAGGTMFDTPSNDVMTRTGIIGGKIDMQDAGYLLDAHSCFYCEWGNFEVQGNSTTSTVFRLSADSTAGTTPIARANTRHVAHNFIHDVRHAGNNFGTFLHARRNNSVGAACYGNTFTNLQGDATNVCGIRLTGVDNCQFYGEIQFELAANGARGLITEDDTVASVATSEIIFQYLNVDGFTNLPGTNRVGISLEDTSSMIRIFQYVAGGSGITNDLATDSTVDDYDIHQWRYAGTKKPAVHRWAGSGEMERWERKAGAARVSLKSSAGGTGSIGDYQFLANDGGGTETTFARIEGVVDDATDTSEDGTIKIRTMVAGTERVIANFGSNGYIGIADGISQPGTVSGMAYIFVAQSDGDLKIVFGDGTVKTIVTDT